MFLYRISQNKTDLIFFVKLLYSFPLFLPVSFLNLLSKLSLDTLAKRIRLYRNVFLALDLLYMWFIWKAGSSLALIVDVKRVFGLTEPVIYFNYLPYALYVLLIGIPFVSAFYLAYKQYKNSKNDKEKVRLFFIVSGVLVPVIVTSVTNITLPSFGYFELNWVGQLTVGIAPIFVVYGILKYNIFNFELFVAELLVFVILIQNLFSLILDETLLQFYIDLFTFALLLLLSIWLLYNIKQEHLAKDKLESQVKIAKQLNEHLREISKKKTEFLSIATHQLRAPLTVLKGQISLLYEGNYGALDKKQKKAVAKIQDSTKRLSDTIDDFLNAARIEQGRLRYNFQVLDIKSLLEDLYNELLPYAKENNLELSFGYDPGTEYIIYADKEKIRHVIFNLLENAIKYTREGYVKLSIKKTRHGALRISVKDSGVGINKEDLKTLFNKFIRAKNIYGVNVEGSGLGLYIAREIVYSHNGRIWAESKGEGKGSEFIIEFPEYHKK